MKILIVEDDPNDTLLIKRTFARSPMATFDATYSVSLRAAVEALQCNHYDLALVDMGLPEANGIDSFLQLRRHAKDLPIVVMTGQEDEELAVSLVQHGAQDYLVKGAFDDQLLIRCIRYAYERHKLYTKLVRRTEELQASRAHIREIIENNGDGILVIDHQGIVRFANPAAEALFGRGPGDMPGDKIDFPTTTGKVTDFVIDNGSGSHVDTEIRMVEIDWEGERVLLASIRDVTKRRKLAGEMLKSQKMETISVLAGGIAHDFNNLLTSILANISLTQLELEENDYVSENLVDAEKSVRHATDLTRQLLTFAKGGAPIRATVSISKLLTDAVTFTLSGSTSAHTLSIPEDIKAASCDEGQIGQALQNIVLNADEAMPGGGNIEISADCITIRQDDSILLSAGEYVRITVADSGEGIPEENLPRVFDPFFTTRHDRSGLGLSAAYSIVRNHDGLIDISSRAGQSTTVTVFLPAVEAVVPTRAHALTFTRGVGRVLIMDDDVDILKVYSKVLQVAGYAVDTAEDGREALTVFTRSLEAGKRYDVVILDLTVPGGMGGVETIRRMLDCDPTTKAIVCSGYAEAAMANYKKWGFTEALMKPVGIALLTETIRKVIVGN